MNRKRNFLEKGAVVLLLIVVQLVFALADKDTKRKVEFYQTGTASHPLNQEPPTAALTSPEPAVK